jgi:pyruvate dehydrogenase E2 component (dihydrolipoamide acetyltransferase)
MSTLRAFTMPKWGIEMTEGTLAEWNVREGESVTKGQVVAQIETDKIVNEVQSEFDTAFVRLIAVPGEIYPVGALLAVMSAEGVAGESIDEFVRTFRGSGSDAPPESAAGAGGPAAARAPGGRDLSISPAAKKLAESLKLDAARITGSGRAGRITYQDVQQAGKPARTVGGGSAVSIEVKTATLDEYYASPGAKRVSLEHRVDLSKVTGTGPRGRISREDVAKAAGISLEARGGQSSFESVRMSATRKAIARQLTASKSSIPHFYLRTQVDMDALLALRAEAKRGGGRVPSINDYIIRACALALAQVPDVNIQVHGDEIRRFHHADIAVAVAAERGLITPIVRAADTKSVTQISTEMHSLIQRAHSAKLRSEDIEGGSFSVSNLGMYGIDQFDAIINPPQGAILAVGSAARRPIERGGGLFFASAAQFSLSCDHRAIDGAVGAEFLAALRDLLQAPERL